MNNIELKVEVGNHTAIHESLKQNPSFVKEAQLEQTDTYFHTKQGRMKLREINNEHYELIYYERPDIDESKLSTYEILSLSSEQFSKLKTLLQKTIGISIVVHKRRELWKYYHTRVHVDEIDGLGNYLELETVIEEGLNFVDAQNEHNTVIDLLGLSSYLKCSGSYSDLLLAQSPTAKV